MILYGKKKNKTYRGKGVENLSLKRESERKKNWKKERKKLNWDIWTENTVLLGERKNETDKNQT